MSMIFFHGYCNLKRGPSYIVTLFVTVTFKKGPTKPHKTKSYGYRDFPIKKGRCLDFKGPPQVAKITLFLTLNQLAGGSSPPRPTKKA